MPKIIKERRVQDDAWKVVTLAAGETAASVRLPVGPLLVPLAVWRARRAELIAREYEHGEPLGVWLAPDEGPETLLDDLDDFTVVAVHFPKFADGRGYSTARLLRERYGYRSELRAFGDVGRDQIFYLNRVGFDSFMVGTGRDATDALAAFGEFPEVYQGAVDQPLPLFRRRA
ncbi:MAG: DUF934 domain-containing protein [Rhodocyclales bacterium]|nr:DUF934 domain-containing protein [Rhodocyclales bacterium]